MEGYYQVPLKESGPDCQKMRLIPFLTGLVNILEKEKVKQTRILVMVEKTRAIQERGGRMKTQLTSLLEKYENGF